MKNKMLMGGVLVVVALMVGIVFLIKQGSSGQTDTNTTSTTDTTKTATMVEDTKPATSGGKMNEATPATKTKDLMVKGEVKDFTITGSSFKFVPNQIKVKKGDKVKVTFKNAQGIHNFVIDQFDVATKQLQGGKEETVEFVADTTGSYEFYCSVGNHRAMGMKGTLLVE